MMPMWLTVLQRVLYAMALLFVCAAAFVAGVFVARINAPDTRPLELPETPPAQVRQAKQWIEDALAARFEGNNKEALELFNRAAAADPSLKSLDYQRGLTFLFDGDFASAENAANAALGKKEDEANAYALLVMCAAARAAAGEKTDSAKVEEWTAQSRAKDPLGPFVHYAMGEYLRTVGKPREAVEYYRKALERVSGADSFLVATVKAGLSGIRLGQNTGSKGFMPSINDENIPPEWLFFAAGDALLRGDKPTAQAFLERAKKVVQPEIFAALLKDSFFQDFLPEGIPNDPQRPDPP